ncbi:MAG: DUF2029 domain-containing protein [Gemmataceae bacterium]|nr:DUF2029 domain-containing protein [Gemmataceae bacterium]
MKWISRIVAFVPGWRSCLLLGLALVVAVWQAPNVASVLKPPLRGQRDSFQEWAAAKNFWNGRPIYSPHAETLPLYLDVPARLDRAFIEINAHPPVAVLFALPSAALPYPRAHLLWNVLSLAMLAVSAWWIARALGLRILGGFGIALIFVAFSTPLRTQLLQGQLNLVLLVLITGTWLANRAGRPGLAGALLGVATAIKLLPALLFLHFALQRRWRAVAVGIASTAACILATLAILGPQAFQDYATHATPQMAEWRSNWENNSLAGYWAKLFDPGTKGSPVAPFFRAPLLARALTLLSCAALIGLLTWAGRGIRSRRAADLAFGLTVLAIPLVSPVSWEHYFLILLLPLAILWQHLPVGLPRWAFWGLVLVLWPEPWQYHHYLGRIEAGSDHTATPWNVVTEMALQMYALLGLFALNLSALRRAQTRDAEAAGTLESVRGCRMSGPARFIHAANSALNA